MRIKRFAPFVVFAFAGSGTVKMSSAFAEGAENKGKDHVAIVEFAATAEREISERSSHLGPAIGASTNWSHGTHWELELPFKKPFRLSESVEVMPGLGPTWSHTTQTGQRQSAWGVEAVVDFFFWHGKHVGWYLEPSYGDRTRQ